MTGEVLKPNGRMEFEELVTIYKEQIQYLVEAGVDLLVVETMMSLAEARAAVIAAKEVCDLPIMVTLTFEKDGRTLYGTDAITAAICLESLGVSAIGMNCSSGPAAMAPAIAEMVGVTNIPIIAKPNAGLPVLSESGETYYSMEADAFVQEMKELVQAGASILGGCCGTTPLYLKKLIKELGRENKTKQARKPKGVRYITSERKTVSFHLDDKFMIVGERINPTGKKQLQAQLREGSFEKVITFAEEQEQNGAEILDVNMGMSGIDEKEMMLRAIDEISVVTNLPLSLDSSYVEVLEAALRKYPGRALINSISYETEKIEKLLPLAAKYGAMFILLPLSDKGLPADIEEKKEIIQAIYQRAKALGMDKEDIIVDGLVTTVGANKEAAKQTLETIRYCHKNGFATICGLSNISFGMPQRGFVNTAFLTLAIGEGLNMAIANPNQTLLTCCAFATDMLLAKEEADIRYIEYVEDVNCEGGLEVSRSTSSKGQIAKEDRKPVKEQIYHAVLKGNRSGILDLVKEALTQGEDPQELLNQVLLPAINEVGALFDQGKYFLPQLIASAEAMKTAIEVLEPLLQQESNTEKMPVVIIATVEGDIHDIGKNLVALMLRNYGFQVIDLGKDVPEDKILEAAKKYDAHIIALSALMTTTMQRMREIVQAVKREKLDARVMIGGAVVTQEYANEIGADGYSKDAADAVKLAKRLNS